MQKSIEPIRKARIEDSRSAPLAGNDKRRSSRTLMYGSFSLLALTFAGCASAGATPELYDARRSYEQVRYSDATEYAPAKVLEARQALERAEIAHADDPGSFYEKSRAYVALRRAKLATTYASIEKSRREQVAAAEQYKEKQEALRLAAERDAASARR